MAIDKVRAYFRQYDMEDKIMEFEVSSATVELAAIAVGVEGARICKTLSFKDGEDGCILIQTAGDTKIDNRKFKDTFGFKAKMLTAGLYRTRGRRGLCFCDSKPKGQNLLRRIHEALRNGFSGLRQ